MTDLGHDGLSLYVHIPWCVKKCPYCDFNSHQVNAPLPVDDYRAALVRNLRAWLPLVGDRSIRSIFFGGGTPSLMTPAWFHSFMSTVQDLLVLDEGCEVTMELNPGATEHGALADYRSAGINRLSIGVQSFDAKHLQTLGRIHSSSDAEQVVAAAHRAGFDRINVDLMYGLPEQSADGALADLETALALPISHLSWYHLTIEPNTVFHSKPPKGLPNDDWVVRLEREARYLLRSHGFERYEVSAYAKQGQESRHNLGYWQFGDYIGIGAGAHGKITDVSSRSVARFKETRMPNDYLNRWPDMQPIRSCAEISEAERPLEFMMNALRLVNGFTVQQFESSTLLSFEAVEERIRSLMERGVMAKTKEHYHPTEQGLNYLDSVVAAFIE